MESFFPLSNSNGFMPHGMCFLWQQDILYTHVAADTITGLAYYGITAALAYIFIKRDDLPHRWLVIPFGILMFFACGTSHFFSIWTIWNPNFGTEAFIKAITGIVSAATAIILWYLMPQVITLPSPTLLRTKNEELQHEVLQRRNAEKRIQDLNEILEQRVKERTRQLENINKKLRKEITERQRAEKTIVESEQKFRNIVEGSIQGIFVHRNYQPLFANQKCADIFGYDNPEQIMALDSLLEAFWVPEERERAKDYDVRRMAGGNVPSTHQFQGIRKDGTPFWFEKHATLIDWKGVKATQAAIIDISDRKQADEQLTYQAKHDTLTGLVNRQEFENRTERLLSTIKHEKGEYALCYLDLDQFKVVNDTCGHAAGDELLRQISSVLSGAVRHRDTLARLGGDEFGVLMEHCSLGHAYRVAESLQRAIQEYQFSWEGHNFRVGVSIGLVPIIETTTNLAELMKNADMACYMAKDMGRNRIQTYHIEHSELAKRHGEMHWVERLNQALEEDRFCLYAQAIVPLDDKPDKHYELLLRMKDVEGNIILPGDFLPAAERYNLIVKLDRWVIGNTFQVLSENSLFLNEIDFCSINLSGQSLTDPEILDLIIIQLNKTCISGKKICFEITETAAISNLSIAMKFIASLRGLGCQFALDDFGSGLSSFAYLKNLSVDFLKIDGMFVKDIVNDPIDHAMVKSINEIGHIMGIQTIAEFVENDVIKGMLKEIGVDYVQGYGLGKPYPLEQLVHEYCDGETR